MNILDILNNEILNLPKSRKAGEENIPFPNYYLIKLKEFRELILQLDNFIIADNDNYMGINNNDLVKRLSLRLICGIHRTIIKYYNGNPIQAYSELEKFLSNNPNPIENIKAYLSLSTLTETRNLFRLRTNEPDSVFGKKDLFHVPYEEREIITTKRYSISGFPSLYLSNSIYTAAIELNVNSLKNISASRFILNSEFCTWPYFLLDLSNRTNYYRQKYIQAHAPLDGPIMRFLITWPLIMASSLKVNKPANPFIPEYIIPQLLLMWIRASGDDIGGIKYSSSHIPLSNLNYNGKFFNVVIPCKDVGPTGYCSYLRRLLKMTYPICNISEEVEMKKNDFDINTIEENGQMIEYVGTNYSVLEKKLIISKVDTLK